MASLVFGDGNDLIQASLEADIITSGEGSDTISGTVEELAGDTILDFSGNDVLLILDESFTSFDYQIDYYPEGETSQGMEISLSEDGDLNLIVAQPPMVSGFSFGWDFRPVVDGVIGYFWYVSGSSDADVLDVELGVPHGYNSGVFLVGYGGNDFIQGTPNDDVLGGEDGSDTIYGNAGNDQIVGNLGIGSAPNFLSGGEGHDTVEGGAGNDTLYGDAGDDSITGAEGDDLIDGGDGADTIFANDGEDTILGGPGNDVLGSDWLYVGDSQDVGSLIEGGDGDDSILGANGGDTLSGGDGNDTIEAGGAQNILEGNAGNDLILGGNGTDTIIGDTGNDTLIGGDSEDDVRDVMYGGAGNDDMNGGYGNDELRGDAGNDSIAGGFGADTVIGGTGNDTLTGSAFSDQLFGGDGDDFVNGGWGHDRVNGGAGADQFFHIGIFNHGSDWIQDYDATEGDVLLFGNSDATRSQFQINPAHRTSADGERAGDNDVAEAFVIYRPTGQIMWALVDGMGQDSINLQIGEQVFDLMA